MEFLTKKPRWRVIVKNKVKYYTLPFELFIYVFCSSYNPYDGPNEHPEAELPLVAGKYLYVYGTMDEDGFYEGLTCLGIV